MDYVAQAIFSLQKFSVVFFCKEGKQDLICNNADWRHQHRYYKRADQPFWKMETYKRGSYTAQYRYCSVCTSINCIFPSGTAGYCYIFLKKRKHSDGMPLAARSFKYPLLPGYWWTVKIKTALTRSVPLNFSLKRDFILRRETSLWIKETKKCQYTEL